MSGITGIFYPDGKRIRLEDLRSMSQSLAHRGLDGSDEWISEKVGLAQRMLWTTPESLLEKLPFRDRDRKLVIVADARIDNRQELISRLEINDLPAEKITDSCIILRAYYRWGDRCPQELLGDFAFAIWDEGKQQMFCARDPMGIKPFSYYHSSHIFAFASEIKALLCLSEIPQKINELKIAYQLAMFCEDQEITYYENILHLPAAHSLTVDAAGNIKIERYWLLDINRRIKLSSDREYSEAFKEIFVEAVRCRLRSAFPVGSTLSGGLDSSSIACTANQLLANSGGKDLHTFSAIFPSLPAADLRKIDERHYMKQVQALSGIIPHEVRADLLDPLLGYLWQEEEPVLSFNIYIHDGLYKCAQQNGVRVFLDGVDGDSTVSHGWKYLTALAYKGRWRKLYRELNAVRKTMGFSRKLVFKEYCLKPFYREPIEYFSSRFGSFKCDLIASEFAKKVSLSDRIKTLSDLRIFETARRQHWGGLTTGLYPFAMGITDKASSKWSLEARYPFFDRRLMEFCLAIPLEQKFSQGYSRAILRHAMEGILPPEIQWRVTKSRLGSNFSRQLLDKEGSTIKNVIHQHQRIKSYVNMSLFASAYERYATELSPRAGDDLNIFNGTLLSLWLNNRF